MKAKVLYTGKIVEVKLNLNSQPTAKPGAKSVYEDSDGNTYFDTELDFKKVYPDWQQVRIQAAIAIMAANHTSPELMQFLTTKEYFPFTSLAKVSVKSADALVSELQKSMEL